MKRIKKCILLIALVVFAMALPVNASAAAKINKKSVTLIKGQTATLKITGTKSKVSWSSNRKTVAAVSSKGKVTAKGKGTATITATIGKKKYGCKVTVQTPALNMKSATINSGESVKLKLSGTNQKVAWKSSNKSVATVSNGTVTAKSAGTCTITATVLNKKYTCKITVPEKFYIPAKQRIYAGNNIKIRTNGIKSDDENVKLTIYIENNSPKNLTIYATSFAVNGIMSNESIYHFRKDIPDGKKMQDTLDISKAWMKENKIKDIRSLDIMFHAFNKADVFDSFDTGVISIGDGYRKSSSGKRVYSGNGITVKFIKAINNKLYFSIKCTGKRYISIYMDNIAINDWSYDKPIFEAYDEQILPSCDRVLELDIDNDFLSENSISKIKKFEFGLKIKYNGDYMNTVNTDTIVTTIG